jgi:hypothetical protein
MTMMRRSHARVAGGVALLAVCLLAASASAQEVGKASAVNPAATANLRTISIGTSIEHKERIKTTTQGSVQLLFLDKTSMTIGPNSDLVIDEYVYDPNAGSGKLAATLGKGALRFVGGQISHRGEAEIKTADAVIGIRGGVALITKAAQTSVFSGYGNVTVTSGGASVSLPPGGFTQTQGAGNPPAAPGAPPAGFVSAQLQQFQSSGGQSGGAAAGTVSPAAVARAETNATGSSTGTVAQVAQVTNGTVRVASTTSSSSTGSATLQQTQTLSNIVQSVQTSTTTTGTAQVAAQILQQFSAAVFVLNSTNCCDPNNPTSSVPYVPGNFATGPGYVSQMLGYRSASAVNSTNPNRGGVMQFGIGINGVGAAQTSWIFLDQGAFIPDGKGGVALTTGFDAFRMGAANQGIGFAGGAISSPPGGVTTGSNLIPTGASVQNLYLEPENLQYLSNNPGFSLGNGTPRANYSIGQTLTQGTVPTDLGTNRPAVTLTAYAGGLMRTFDQTGNAYLSPSFAVVGSGSIALDPSLSKVQANLFVANVSSGAVPADTFAAGNYQFGSLTLPRAKSAYVDYNNFAARAAQTVPDLTTGTEVPVSTIVTKGGTQPGLNFQGGSIVTVTPAVQQQIAPALSTGTINFCQCDYTRWGFWANTENRTGSNGDTLSDIGTLMTWVAGQLPGINDVPKTGTATYDGMVVASIKNSGNQYLSGGNFTNTVNFGTQTGTVTVTNLDSTNYSGTVSFNPSDPRNFSGGLVGNLGGRTMALNGSFFKGVAGPVAEMGGNVSISGTSYIGAGIFAAKMR